MIISLLVLLLLSTIAAALIFTTQTEMWSSLNYRMLLQSRYAAEAGAQQAINWLEYTYTPPTAATIGSYDMTKTPVQYNGAPVVLSTTNGASNYPEIAVKTAFNAALGSQSIAGLPNTTYSLSAELIYMRSVNGAFGAAGTQYLQTWQITSQGIATGVKNAVTQVIETIEKPARPSLLTPPSQRPQAAPQLLFPAELTPIATTPARGLIPRLTPIPMAT